MKNLRYINFILIGIFIGLIISSIFITTFLVSLL